jgi:anti-sigma B factor antagonist
VASVADHPPTSLRRNATGSSTEVKDHERPFDIDEVPPLPEVDEHALPRRRRPAELVASMQAIAEVPRDPRNGKDLNVANQPFDVERRNSETKLTIRGSLDIKSAPLLAEEIDRVVATKPPKVKVDLSALDLIDCSGVAALVKLYRGVRGNGGAIAIRGARDQPLAIFKLLRMDHVFNL